MNDTGDMHPKPGLRLRGLQIRSGLGILALVLQLVLPAVHSIEIRRELGAGPAVAPPSESQIARLTTPSPSRHDPTRCPICSDLAHLQSLTQEAAHVAVPIRLELRLVVAFPPLPPAAETASAEARAPPSRLLA
jgi:hypothetical protein